MQDKTEQPASGPSFNEGKIVEYIQINRTGDKHADLEDSLTEVTITRYFKGNKTREYVKMQQGYTITIIDRDLNKKLILANVGGEKKYAKVDIEQDEKRRNIKLKVREVENDKMILDYPCKKYMVKFMGVKGVVYTTNNINVVSYHTEFNDQIDGYPLLAMFKVSMFGINMRMKLQATEVSAMEVPDIKFSFVVPKGFEESTQKEIRDLFGKKTAK